jgi:hypothetical protein
MLSLATIKIMWFAVTKHYRGIAGHGDAAEVQKDLTTIVTFNSRYAKTIWVTNPISKKPSEWL